MRFRVVWPRHALAALAQAYTAAATGGHGAAVATSMAQIEQLLAVNPQHVGESRGNGDRIFILWPLVVEYEVFGDDKVVVVLDARYHP